MSPLARLFFLFRQFLVECFKPVADGVRFDAGYQGVMPDAVGRHREERVAEPHLIARRGTSALVDDVAASKVIQVVLPRRRASWGI